MKRESEGIIDWDGYETVSILYLVSLGHIDIVAWILDNYPEVADIPNKTGNVAVHFAAASGEYIYIVRNEFEGEEVAIPTTLFVLLCTSW